MVSDEYLKALDKAVADLGDRVQRRDLLNAEIAGLRETVRVLSNRVILSPERQRTLTQLLELVDYATPSLNDAIRALLTKVYPREMTAIEVRNALEESGFNFDDFSNSLSACHAALKRMSPEEIETGTPKDGKSTYKRVFKIPTWHPANSWDALIRDAMTPKTETHTVVGHSIGSRVARRRNLALYGIPSPPDEKKK